jgi:hypothetical protein
LRTTAFARAPRRRFPLARRFALERANDVLNFPLQSSSSKTFLFLLFVVKEAREEEEEQKPQLVKVLVHVVVILVSFFLSLSAR